MGVFVLGLEIQRQNPFAVYSDLHAKENDICHSGGHSLELPLLPDLHPHPNNCFCSNVLNSHKALCCEFHEQARVI